MKTSLVTAGHKIETAADRKDIAFKSHETNLKNLPLGQRVYDAPQADLTVGIRQGEHHKVGQIHNNLQKVSSVLKKTKFAG